jgi:REP element-mobilizing transposase RayT
MPRTARVELAGGIHHVGNVGNGKQAIFREDADRLFFLAELQLIDERHACRTLSYCLMTNHLHLVVETERTTLGEGMRDLFGRHAKWMNRRYGKTGHLFEDRFWSRLVTTDEYFAQLLRYLALNPVEARLCADPSEWHWSSHRKLMSGTSARVEALLESAGGAVGTRYARLFDPAHQLAVKYGAQSPWKYRPALSDLLRGPDLDAAMRRARAGGYRVNEIAEAVGLHRTTVSRRTRPL